MKTPPYGAWRPEVKRLWKKAHAEFDLDPEGTETLRVACDSLEAFYTARDVLAIEGLTFTTPTGIRKHPAVEICKTERAGFLSAMRQLGLEWNEPKEKRRPGRPGVYGV